MSGKMTKFKDLLVDTPNRYTVNGEVKTIVFSPNTITQEGTKDKAEYFNEMQKNGLYNVNATRLVEGTVEFYDVEIEGSDIFDVFNTQFIINFNETNTKLNPILRFNGNNYYIRALEGFIDIDVQVGSLQKTYIGFLDSANNKLKLMNYERKLTFDTVEDMQTVTWLVEGDTIELLGYYSKNDGAGHYRKIESSDDGSGIAAGGLWANVMPFFNGEVNINWFGAKSDGSDNREIIQKVINFVGISNGGIIKITDDTFYISINPTDKIGLKINYSNIKITGTGTIKLLDNQLTGVLNYSSTMILVDTFSSNETDTIENITIKGIKIDHNCKNNVCFFSGYSEDALTIRHCINAIIEENIFTDTIDSSIMFTSNKKSRIINNNFVGDYRYCTVNTISGSTHITSNDANFTQYDLYGCISIKRASSDSGVVFSAIIIDVLSPTEVVLQLRNTSIELTVYDTEALICRTEDSAIYVSDYWLTQETTESIIPFSAENTRKDRTDNIIISGNIITGLAHGVHCHRGTSRMLISGNRIKHCFSGVDLSHMLEGSIDGYTAIPQKNTIIENNIENCFWSGISLMSSHFSIITNNIILNATRGIDCSGSSYSSISDNIILGDLIASTTHRGISLGRGYKDGVEYYSSYNVVSNNIVSKFWFGIFEHENTINNVYNGNQVDKNRSENSTTDGYFLNSNLYCLDGVWCTDSITGKIFPIKKGTVAFENYKLRVFNGVSWNTVSNYKSSINAANSPTINAEDCTFIILNNYTINTSITSITNGETGQELSLYFTNNFATLKNSNNLRLDGNKDYTPPSKTCVKLICLDGSIWAEISRSSQS